MADITVQVSSVGLTTTTGSLNEGWGRLTWGSIVWGEDFENVTVSVTTPGAPTTWGQSTYGNYSWGQITGVQSETGEELIEAGASVILSTNLLNIVNASVSAEANFIIDVIGTQLNSTVNSVFAGETILVEVTTNIVQFSIGDETIEGTGSLNLTGVQSNTSTGTLSLTADANLNLNTNLLNTTVGTIDHKIDVDVEVNAPGNLPWGATYWGSGSWGNIGGMEVSQGAEEEVVPSIDVFVSTNLLTLTLTSIAQITADANITANTNLLTTSLGNEDAVPNTIVTLSTNLLNVSVGAASGEVLSTVSPTGVSATASTGRVFIAAWAVVDIGVTNTWSVVDIAA